MMPAGPMLAQTSLVCVCSGFEPGLHGAPKHLFLEVGVSSDNIVQSWP